MAVNSVTHPSLLDLANRLDPDGKIAPIIEIMNQQNDAFEDMVWLEGNLPTGHKSTMRTGIPAPTWRKMYGGVQPTKSATAQVVDTCGMLEAYAEVDLAMAKLNGNTAEWRLSEDRPHLEGMSQELMDTLFHGNETTEPEAFTGLSPRYNSLSAKNAENIINGGGAGSNNGSIWLVGWSEHTCHGIVPKGSTAGIQQEDKGQVTLENADGNNGRMEAYRTWYHMSAGLALSDWRYVARIPNIDKSALSVTYNNGTFASGANLPELMFQAMERIPNMSVVRPAFYMSRQMRTVLRQQTSAAVQGSTLTAEMVGGKLVESFHGIPVRRCDVLAADETLVA